MSYDAATFDKLEPNDDGTWTMVFKYTGSAGEPVRFSRHAVNTAVMPDANYARALAMERIAVLNVNRSFGLGAAPNVSQPIDVTTPLPVPVAPIYASYRAASAPFAPGATPQDVFTISGSATRTVRVTEMGIYTVQTTAGINAWLLNRRSAANTGGTSAVVAAVPNDDAYLAATAVVRQYTVNPVAGALLGSPWSGRIVSPAPASLPSMLGKEIVFGRAAIILSGASDVLSWNLGGIVLPAGLSVQAYVSWEESAG